MFCRPRRSRSIARRLRAASALPLACLFAAAVGCGEEAAPVARLDVQPQTISLAHGTYVDVELAWTPVAELAGKSGDLRVFLHLLGDDGQVARTFDHPLAGDWHVGEELRYRARIYQSFLAPPLPAGSYRLTAGLHDAAGTRWPLETGSDGGKRFEYQVAEVTVPAAPPRLPTIGFSDAWSPTMAGGDRQVVAYRWLTGDGVVRLDDVGGAGTLWLDLEVPREGEGNMRRTFRNGGRTGGRTGGDTPPPATANGAADDGGTAVPLAEGEPPAGPAAELATGAGAQVPTVAVSTDCGDFSATRSGAGSHRVEVPVAAATAATAAAGCTIELSPNFFMLQSGAGRRSVLLQNVAWKSGG